MGQTPYLIMSDLSGLIPAKFLCEALDDNGDGQADTAVFNQLVIDAGLEVDKAIGGDTGFSNPLPFKVKNAAKFIAVELLYKRRGRDDKNPYAKDVAAVRQELADVASGKIKLQTFISLTRPAVSAITQPVKTNPVSKTNA